MGFTCERKETEEEGRQPAKPQAGVEDKAGEEERWLSLGPLHMGKLQL